MLKTLVKVIFLVLLTVSVSFSQRKAAATEEDAVDKSKYLGFGLTTNTRSGIIGGFAFRSSKQVSQRKNGLPVHRYLGLELVNVKHPKEYQSMTAVGTKFIYGKTNYLWMIRPEFGREWYFFDRNGESSIGLSGILAAGPSIGIQKPYYIKYGRVNGEQDQTVVFDPDIHTDISKITGSAGMFYGFLNNAVIIPGLHLKAATSIDMSTFGDNITGFELGAMFEFLFKEPEIISSKLSSNPQAFATVYLTLYFGSKKRGKKK